MDIEGILLTGGASRRMGQDKSSLRLGDDTLAEIAARKLQSFCSKVTVLGPEPVLGIPNLADREAHTGPLAAIANFAPSRPLIAILSCDMPLITPDVFSLLAENLGSHQVAVSLVESRLQPTCAVYTSEALGIARETYGQGKRSLMAWLDSLSVVQVPFPSAQFQNVNTPEDWIRLQEDLRAEPSPSRDTESSS